MSLSGSNKIAVDLATLAATKDHLSFLTKKLTDRKLQDKLETIKLNTEIYGVMSEINVKDLYSVVGDLSWVIGECINYFASIIEIIEEEVLK